MKTSTGGSPNWILNKKAESYHAENHYYVFVVLHDVGNVTCMMTNALDVLTEYAVKE